MANGAGEKKKNIRKTGARHRFKKRRPWMEVLHVIFTGAGNAKYYDRKGVRTIKPFGSTKTFKTDEIVWSERPDIILGQLKVAEKIWGIEFVHHSATVAETTFMFMGEDEHRSARALHEFEAFRDLDAEAINAIFQSDADALHPGPRAVLFYTCLDPDQYSTDGIPLIGGITCKRQDHAELITDVSFIFNDAIGAKPDSNTTAHELGHLLGDLGHSDDEKNLMHRSKRGHGVTKSQIEQVRKRGKAKGHLRYGPKPPLDP